MRVAFGKTFIGVLLAGTVAGPPALANRLTIEMWPDANPDHALFCSVAVTSGWFTLVQVRGAGLPPKRPLRWPASDTETEALATALQAFVAGDLASVDPYRSRLPPPPFVTVTWRTTLDDTMTTGLYIQTGLDLPAPLEDLIKALGPRQPCGLP